MATRRGSDVGSVRMLSSTDQTQATPMARERGGGMATHPECRGTGTCRNASDRIVLGRLTNRSARSGPVGGAAGPRQRTSGRRSRHQTAQRRRWRGRGGAGQRDASCCPIAGERSVESAGNVPVWLDRFAGIAGARVVAFLVVEVGRELCMRVKVKLPCWPNPRQAGLQMPSMEPKLAAAAVLLWLKLRVLILSGQLPLAAVARSAENLTLASELHRRVCSCPAISRASSRPFSDLRPPPVFGCRAVLSRVGPNASRTAAGAPPAGCCQQWPTLQRRSAHHDDGDGPREPLRPPPHHLASRRQCRRPGQALCLGQVAGRLQAQVQEDNSQEDGRQENRRYVLFLVPCVVDGSCSSTRHATHGIFESDTRHGIG